MMNGRLLRIMDANLNRAREGLRVCEDIVRFVIEDAYLARSLKQERHRLTKIFLLSRKTHLRRLIAARDAKKDILKDCDYKKLKRSGIKDIFMSNMERVKESLRVLEECSKVIDAGLGDKLKRLRFESYDAEKRFSMKWMSQ